MANIQLTGVLEIEKGGNEIVKEIIQEEFPESKDKSFQMVRSTRIQVFLNNKKKKNPHPSSLYSKRRDQE